MTTSTFTGLIVGDVRLSDLSDLSHFGLLLPILTSVQSGSMRFPSLR